MLLNYLKTTYRHLLKNKLHFLFKLGGLTVAFLGFLIIAIYVSLQFSFDRFNEGYENIYRVNSERKENGSLEKYAIVPLALGPMINSRFPEIKAATRIRGTNQRIIRYNDKVLGCTILESDTSLFDVFTIPFIKGDRESLKRHQSIVLTKTLANKLFGKEEPLHKTVKLTNGDKSFEVTAVIEDIKSNSHLSMEALIPISDSDQALSIKDIISPVEFVDRSTILYLRFNDHPKPEDFEAKLTSLLDARLTKKDRIESGFKTSLQPLKDIYLAPPLNYEFTRKGSAVYIALFSLLAVFILVVASINYINISAVDFNGRSREIGVRQVMGARKRQIAFQIVVEAMGYCLSALILSIGVLYLVFPNVVQKLDVALRFEMLTDTPVIFSVSLLVVLLILFSSAIPAYRLAISNSAANLKGGYTAGHSLRLSRALLLAQFVTSILCISASYIVGKQIHFIHTKDLGFDRRNLMVMLMPEGFSVKQMQALKTQLAEIPGVSGVSNSSFKIGGGYWKDWYNVEVRGQMKSIELYEVFSDDALFKTLGMKLIEGRTFMANNPADSGSAFVINETAAHELGWDEPLGKRIVTHPEEKGKFDGTVVGVVKDIHIGSLYEKVHPLVMRLPWQKDYPEYFLYVRMEGPIAQTVSEIKNTYRELLPMYPMDFDFVDEYYNSIYQNENKAFDALQMGTWIIILISSLGIFSLSVFMSLKRLKEFGIRKVLGASASQITFLHVSNFLRLALLANVMALPLAYWTMNLWLDGFAYRVVLDSLVFMIVACISFLLVIVSAGYPSWRAGRMNPIDAIRLQ